MKLVQSILMFLFLTCCSLYSTEVPLRDIKDSLRIFITKTEVLSDSFYVHNDLSNDLIRDTRLDKGIEEGKNGIFLFNILSHHQNLHFVLIDDTGFEIINMRETLDENMEKLISHFKRNGDYTKEDILFYISDFIRIYHYNEKINSREGPIL